MLKSIKLRPIIYLLVIAFIFCSGCHEKEADRDGASPLRLKMPSVSAQQPLDLEPHVYDLIKLRTRISADSLSFGKVEFNKDFVYLLDKANDKLYVQGITHNNLTEINGVSYFYLDKRTLVTYNIHSGMMNTYSLSGKLISTNNMGFRGIEFTLLSDSVLVFYTGGLFTDDKASEKFELSYVNIKGNLLKQELPISPIRQGVNYITQNRFSHGNAPVFIPSLSTQSYRYDGNHFRKQLRIDFGAFNLTDSIFNSIKDVEDYSFFPYILNLTNRFNTPEASFFSYTYLGMEGYVFVRTIDSRIILSGLKSSAGHKTRYLDIVPLSYHNGRFISYNILNSPLTSRKRSIANAWTQTESRIQLIFYRMKGFN